MTAQFAVGGGILLDAAAYREWVALKPERLRELVDNDAATTVALIISGRTDNTLMNMLRSQMIGCALLADTDGVVRWATEGLNRSRRIGGEWAATERQWLWVLENPGRYLKYARQMKVFLNQLQG
jgi:hypothetical protein